MCFFECCTSLYDMKKFILIFRNWSPGWKLIWHISTRDGYPIIYQNLEELREYYISLKYIIYNIKKFVYIMTDRYKFINKIGIIYSSPFLRKFLIIISTTISRFIFIIHIIKFTFGNFELNLHLHVHSLSDQLTIFIGYR